MALDAALLELTARELKQRLADARIDKIFEPTRDEVVPVSYTHLDVYKRQCPFWRHCPAGTMPKTAKSAFPALRRRRCLWR